MQEYNIHEAYSTDWLDTPLCSLSRVESALRCQVCKDFYSTPMITSCSHTFCSLCIRRCLSNDGKCPVCRAQEQELKLRNNVAMEELVEAFKEARSEALEYARKSSRSYISSNPSKRKLEESESNGEISSTAKKTRYSKRLERISENTVISDSEVDDEHKISEICLVRCPICDMQMPDTQVNAHLDRNCKEGYPISAQSGGTSTSSTKNRASISKQITRPKRLPLLNFSMVKDVQLKKKLGEHGLSQGGSRLVMQRRLAEWITLWNANCDATRPRPPRELRCELEKWERAREGRGPGVNLSSFRDVKIKEKDFDTRAWSSSHAECFKELVEKAQQNYENPKTEVLESACLESPVESQLKGQENSTTISNSFMYSDGLNENHELSPQNVSKFFEEPLGKLNRSNAILPEKCTATIADLSSSKLKLP